MISDIKAKVAQLTPVVSGEGDLANVKMTKLGALFTADWRQQLLLGGYVWQARVGTVAAGGAPTKVVGGGNGLTIDLNQPEFVIGVDAGYYLIPMEARCAVQSNCSTDAQIVEIVLIADEAAMPVTTTLASATTHVPVNMFSGLGGSFPGVCYEATTVNITDPVTTMILDFCTWQQTLAASGVGSSPAIRMDYIPEVPVIMAGPCQLVLCWGGSSAASGLGLVTVAAVPAAYMPTS